MKNAKFYGLKLPTLFDEIFKQLDKSQSQQGNISHESVLENHNELYWQLEVHLKISRNFHTSLENEGLKLDFLGWQ